MAMYYDNTFRMDSYYSFSGIVLLEIAVVLGACHQCIVDAGTDIVYAPAFVELVGKGQQEGDETLLNYCFVGKLWLLLQHRHYYPGKFGGGLALAYLGDIARQVHLIYI